MQINELTNNQAENSPRFQYVIWLTPLMKYGTIWELINSQLNKNKIKFKIEIMKTPIVILPYVEND